MSIRGKSPSEVSASATKELAAQETRLRPVIATSIPSATEGDVTGRFGDHWVNVESDGTVRIYEKSVGANKSPQWRELISRTVGGTLALPSGTTLGGSAVYVAGGTDVVLADGGTSASLTADNGGIFYSTASAGAILASTATANKVLVSGASAAPSWSTPTFPNASATAGKAIRSDGTNWLASTFTIPDTMAVSTLLYASSANVLSALATGNSGVLVTGGTGVPSIATDIPTAVTIGGAYIYRVSGTDVALADGGTNASLTASTGGIVYSGASAMAILAGTSTAGQILRSGSSAAPTWSTSTYPAGAITTGTILRGDASGNVAATTSLWPNTTTVSQLLYSSTNNNVTGLATANSGVLVTGGTGVPSIATDIPTAVTIGGAYVYRVSGTDVAVVDGGTGASDAATARTNLGVAPSDATYIVQTASGGLSAEQVLGVLATGLVKNTTTTGVLSIGLADTDYQQPVTWGDGLAYSAPTASVDYNTTNLKITAAQIDTIQSIATAASPTFANLTMGTGGALRTGTTLGNTLLLQAYDTDTGPAYTTFATLTAGTAPTMDLATGVTVGGNANYYATGTDVSLADGGTNASLTASTGGIVYSGASAMAILAGTATANKVLVSGASAAPAWSTPTFPNASATAGKAIRSDGTNWLASTFTIPDTMAISTLLYASSANVLSALATANSGVLVTGGTGIPSIATDIPTAVTIGSAYIYRASGTDVPLLDGGTNASLTASTGGIVYSGASALAILSGTATAGQILRSGASDAPTWSTATYPATTTVSRILYSSSTDVVGEITTANSGVLVTGGTGIPSISTDIPTAVTIGGAYNYRVGGTDVAVADGGTGVGTFTTNGVLYGNGTTSVLVTAQGAANSVLTANAGAPSFSASPTLTSLTLTGDLLVDGTNIGITTDADLMAMAADTLTLNGSLGLGTAPSTLLHLRKDATGAIGPTIRLSNNANAAADQAAIDFWGGAAASETVRGRLAFNIASNGKGELLWSSGITTLTQWWKVDTNGAVLVGSAGSPSAAGATTLIFPDAAEPTLAANTAGLYADDVVGTVEMFAVGEDQTQTQISSHDPVTGEFYHSSVNRFTGRKLRVLLEQLAREVERLSGKKFVFEEFLPVEKRLDWDAVQEERRLCREAEIAAWDESSDTPRPLPFVVKPMPAYIAAAQGV